VLFVAVLRLDSPDEWLPLFGDPREAYTLRRFWGVFWHQILQAPHACYGRLAAQRLLKLNPGSHAYKAFMAFYLFAASAVSHTLINWQTGALGPLLGDARFLMLNFLAAFVEAWVCRTLGPCLRFLPRFMVRAMGFVWVLAFFYCAARRGSSRLPMTFDVSCCRAFLQTIVMHRMRQMPGNVFT
jgi:Membrane bound O-acyl transferase family